MIIIQFILENLYFGINVFAALVFFAVSWLYLDAWLQKKSKKDFFKILGFLLLSLSFLVHSTYIQQANLKDALFLPQTIENISTLIKFFGYILLSLGLFLDPLEKKPVYPSEAGGQIPQNVSQGPAKPVQNSNAGFFVLQGISALVWAVCFPILSFFVFLLYLRRATTGLEKHLKPLTIGFLFIFFYELLSLSKLFENVQSISVYKIVAPFGPVWISTQLFLVCGIIVIAKWVFQYLLKRIQTQLFMILNVSVLIIFLITTLFFTGLLLKTLQDDAISHLNTDVNVVQYSMNSKQAEILSDAQVVAQNPQVISAILARDTRTLKDLSTSVLITKREAFLIILASSGAVLMRGENSERIGDSLSNDPLFIKAIRGESASSIVVKQGAIAPIVSISSGAPVKAGNDTIGVIIVGDDLDNAFVDGLKTSTKLDVSVYGGNKLSATTFVGADGKSRFIGVKEDNNTVNEDVLIKGKNYAGEISILNVPYFVSFAPLKDINGNPVGMLFVGKEQVSTIQAAAKSIEYTFIITAFLILLSIIPSFFISKFIANQFK